MSSLDMRASHMNRCMRVGCVLWTGNYGKAADVVVKSKKSGGADSQGEDAQPLLDASEDELEREQITDPDPLAKSVTAPRRPQPTEYDR